MTPEPPAAALDVLERAPFCYVAVRTQQGPHVTPLVYVAHGGSLWVTTARGSVKARAWRLDPAVAGLVRSEGVAVAFRGTVRAYDALDPLSWPAAVAGAPRLARAGVAFSLKNARFFAGYAVDAGRVPLGWTPPGRVFAEIRLERGRVLTSEGGVREGWGRWPTGAGYRRTFRPLPPTRPLDLSVPAPVREALETAGDGVLALDADGALTVLPARWRRVSGEGTHDALMQDEALGLSGADRDAPAALAIDRASAWRAADMRGVLLQGTGELFSVAHATRGRSSLRARIGSGDGPEPSLVRLRARRAVWWDGWTSGTVTRP